ncbi:hypothetical protein [Desulfovibrio sp. SGI.169]|uniref:hypothetical protein n=1 Tax=Desulfovibrio sp. SGI.169 TaxID=3420561 RepID=UPI003CFFB022
MQSHDNCTSIRRYVTIRSIQEFAALWCGATEEELPTILNTSFCCGGSTAMGSLIIRNDAFPCLEPRIRFIIDAINDNRVEVCDELGNFRGNENIAWSRKCLRLDKAKEWLENSALPRNELPDFLFQSQTEGIPQTIAGLEEALEKIRKLEETIKEKDTRIAELEQQTINIDTEGPINSQRWQHSCRALAKTFATYITMSYPTPITKNDFLRFMQNRVEGFRNPLGVVENIAWQEFPSHLKSGPGRPKKQDDELVPF